MCAAIREFGFRIPIVARSDGTVVDGDLRLKARKFTEIAEMLARCDVMTELDAGALAKYAVIWCRWVDGEAEIKWRGPVVKTEGGNVIPSHFCRWPPGAICS